MKKNIKTILLLFFVVLTLYTKTQSMDLNYEILIQAGERIKELEAKRWAISSKIVKININIREIDKYISPLESKYEKEIRASKETYRPHTPDSWNQLSRLYNLKLQLFEKRRELKEVLPELNKQITWFKEIESEYEKISRKNATEDAYEY